MSFGIARKIGFVLENEPNSRGHSGSVSWETGFVLARFSGARQDAVSGDTAYNGCGLCYDGFVMGTGGTPAPLWEGRRIKRLLKKLALVLGILVSGFWILTPVVLAQGLPTY